MLHDVKLIFEEYTGQVLSSHYMLDWPLFLVIYYLKECCDETLSIFWKNAYMNDEWKSLFNVQ